MRTNFSDLQLLDPDIRESNEILRKCVHCGFCLTTCPTYALLGDERDSPRGRIYMIQNMLESGSTPKAETVRHVDRCLSCLGCVTACPSGVDYMHLIDNARAHIEQNYRRPWVERFIRHCLAFVLPRPGLFRMALALGSMFQGLKVFFPSSLRRMLEILPTNYDSPPKLNKSQTFVGSGIVKKRVALLPGCVQQVLGSRINEATIRVLSRHGCEVIIPQGVSCCGAIPHHLGKKEQAINIARKNLKVWNREIEDNGLDAIIINASGCGTTIKDYGHMFKDDPDLCMQAEKISSIALDISEILFDLELKSSNEFSYPLTVAYHDSCSMQHGQNLERQPRSLLKGLGYNVREVKEGHMCCGAAGTYNLLQPKISDSLGRMKGKHVSEVGADVVAAANLGCMLQIERYTEIPTVHTVELLDWATGGPVPEILQSIISDYSR